MIQRIAISLLIALSLGLYSCGPTGDKNSTDEKNSNGEGAIDSTRLPNFDSASQMSADSTIVR